MNIFLTGSSGFLGGELLVSLSKRKDVNKIYCLTRAISEEHALLRLKQVFEFHDDFFDKNKIIPVVGNIGDHAFLLTLMNNKSIRDTDIIIHCAANTSFSKIYDNLVEQVNIQGTQYLIKWAQSLKELRTFVYVGTATICGKDVKKRIVREDESPNPQAHHLVKYTYTKMMGEILLNRDIPAEKLLIVRPSIVMGDSRDWLPRSYVILWAMETFNMLRLVPLKVNASMDVIPVDFATNSILSLLFGKRNHSVYHISSGKQSITTPGLLSQAMEKTFPDAPPFRFVEKVLLNQMKLWAKGKLPGGSRLYEFKTYLDYWESIFDDKSQMRILLAALQPYIEFVELGQVFDNTRLLSDTGVPPPEPAHSYITRSVKYLKNIDVFAGAVDP